MPKARFTPDEKAKAVMRHLQDGIAISTICGELSIHPNLFYIWQKQLFSGAASVFENKGKSGQRQHEKQVAELEKRLKDKDGVIAELLEEYTALLCWPSTGRRPAKSKCTLTTATRCAFTARQAM